MKINSNTTRISDNTTASHSSWLGLWSNGPPSREVSPTEHIPLHMYWWYPLHLFIHQQNNNIHVYSNLNKTIQPLTSKKYTWLQQSLQGKWIESASSKFKSKCQKLCINHICIVALRGAEVSDINLQESRIQNHILNSVCSLNWETSYFAVKNFESNLSPQWGKDSS